MEKSNMVGNSAMEELYKIKEANSLRHVDMSTEEIQDELHESVKEFNLLVAKRRKEKQLIKN